MSYKLLATDLDWSLVYDKTKINEENLSSILSLLDKGYYFCVITGRPIFTALPLMVKLGFTKYKNFFLAGYNGGIIYHPYSDTRLFESETISVEEAKKVYEITKEYKVNFMMYKNERVFLDEFFPYKEQEISLSHLPIEKLSINDLNENLIKGIVASDNENLIPVEKVLKEKIPSLDFFISQRFFLEVMKKGVNKGVAIDFLSSYLNVSTEDMVVVGDSYNDIFMLEKVKKSIAVENASEEIKNASSEISKRVQEAHFKEIIHKYFI